MFYFCDKYKNNKLIIIKNFSTVLQFSNNNYISLPPMKQYSQDDALLEIFNQKLLTRTMNVYKHRYAKDELSQKCIDEILLSNGFKIIQEKIYTKG